MYVPTILYYVLAILYYTYMNHIVTVSEMIIICIMCVCNIYVSVLKTLFMHDFVKHEHLAVMLAKNTYAAPTQHSLMPLLPCLVLSRYILCRLVRCRHRASILTPYTPYHRML